MRVHTHLSTIMQNIYGTLLYVECVLVLRKLKIYREFQDLIKSLLYSLCTPDIICVTHPLNLLPLLVVIVGDRRRRHRFSCFSRAKIICFNIRMWGARQCEAEPLRAPNPQRLIGFSLPITHLIYL